MTTYSVSPLFYFVQWRPHSGNVKQRSRIVRKSNQVSQEVIIRYFPTLLMLPGTLFCILGPWTLSVRPLCVCVEPHGACSTLYLLLQRNHGEAFCRTTGSRRFEHHWVEQGVFLLLHHADKFLPPAVGHLPGELLHSPVPSMRPLGLQFTPTYVQPTILHWYSLG